jgi:PKD domain
MSRGTAVLGQTKAGGAGRSRLPVPVLLLVLVAGLLLIPADGASAAGWLPQVNVSKTVPSPSNSVLSLQDVALDGEGNAVAVWIQAGENGLEVIEGATRPAGGSWSKPVTISDTAEFKVELKLVVDPQGDAAAVWIGYAAGEGEIVHAATRPAGGEWSEPVTLSTVGEQSIEPEVAIDAQGNVTAIWVGGVGSEEGVVEASRLPAGDEWSEPVELSDDSRAGRSPQLAVDSQGEVTALWILNLVNRDEGAVQSKTLPAGGEWSADAVDVSSPDALATNPRIALDAQGDATAVWQVKDIPAGSGFHYSVQSALRTDGDWGAPLTISREDALADKPNVAVDPDGNATVIWSFSPIFTGLPTGLQTRSRTAEGSWGDTVFLTTRPGGVEPNESDVQLAADPDGNVTAIWGAWSVPTEVVRAARLPAGGAWSAPVNLSSTSAYSLWPRLAMDPQGYATVLWSGFQAGVHAVRSRVFDPVAPELRDVTVPATGVVGQPVEMSVDPYDLWSPVVSSWDFGDDSSDTGATVEHCYSSPGDYTVALSGTDGAANVSSASETISIEPDPAVAAGSDPCNPQPPDDPGPSGNLRPPNPGGNPNPEPGPTAPVVSDLQQSNSRWRTPGARDRSRLPVGTTFRFALDRPAAVQLAFSRIAAGRQEGARCVKATKANDGAPRCDRSQARGTLEMAGESGQNAYGFRGKIRGRALEPGRYRLLVTALADGQASAAAPIEFTIVR